MNITKDKAALEKSFLWFGDLMEKRPHDLNLATVGIVLRDLIEHQLRFGVVQVAAVPREQAASKPKVKSKSSEVLAK